MFLFLCFYPLNNRGPWAHLPAQRYSCFSGVWLKLGMPTESWRGPTMGQLEGRIYEFIGCLLFWRVHTLDSCPSLSLGCQNIQFNVSTKFIDAITKRSVVLFTLTFGNLVLLVWFDRGRGLFRKTGLRLVKSMKVN